MIFFKKKSSSVEDDDTRPRGVKYSLDRPTDADVRDMKVQLDKIKSNSIRNIDQKFLQDVSDRIYGPDSIEYVRALEELNKSFRGRVGKSGIEFYEPELVESVRDRQRKINDSIKKCDQ